MLDFKKYIRFLLKQKEGQEFDYKKYIKSMKNEKKGLMSKLQYMSISKELYKVCPCNLLVFGLGHDSYLWHGINKNGRTVFLEDDKAWIEEVNNGALSVFKVEYSTKVKDYQEIGYDESKLKMDLPREVLATNWDFIIVDGPLGHQPPRPFNGPGRMSSIFNAYKLLRKGGIAVVDDMGRSIEREYAYHYFGKKNLTNLIEKKVGVFEKDD